MLVQRKRPELVHDIVSENLPWLMNTVFLQRIFNRSEFGWQCRRVLPLQYLLYCRCCAGLTSWPVFITLFRIKWQKCYISVMTVCQRNAWKQCSNVKIAAFSCDSAESYQLNLQLPSASRGFVVSFSSLGSCPVRNLTVVAHSHCSHFVIFYHITWRVFRERAPTSPCPLPALRDQLVNIVEHLAA